MLFFKPITLSVENHNWIVWINWFQSLVMDSTLSISIESYFESLTFFTHSHPLIRRNFLCWVQISSYDFEDSATSASMMERLYYTFLNVGMNWEDQGGRNWVKREKEEWVWSSDGIGFNVLFITNLSFRDDNPKIQFPLKTFLLSFFSLSITHYSIPRSSDQSWGCN